MPNNSGRTTFLGPLVSFRTTKGHESGYVHVHVPSYGTFEADGTSVFDGTVEMNSTLSADGGASVGVSGTRFASVVRSTLSINPGAVAAHDSVSTTATISAMPADALILSAQPASIWSGAYFDLAITAQVSAASTIRIGLANSTLTSVTPDAMNWAIVWADPV